MIAKCPFYRFSVSRNIKSLTFLRVDRTVEYFYLDQRYISYIHYRSRCNVQLVRLLTLGNVESITFLRAENGQNVVISIMSENTHKL